jgi:hypothetical protein
MSAALLCLLFVTGAKVDLRVSAADGRGVTDAPLAEALAQALADAGMPARRPPSEPCAEPCLQVTVRRFGADRFLVEVRARGRLAEAPVQLDATASPYDQAHALAIQVQLLSDRTRPIRRPPPRAPVPKDRPPEPAPSRVAAQETLRHVPPAEPKVEAVPESKIEATPLNPRLALNVAAMGLAGLSGGLFTPGLTVGLDVPLGHGVNLRGGISFLRPQHVHSEGAAVHRELLPLQITGTIRIPGLSALRGGAGLDAIWLSTEDEGRELPSVWSFGAIGRAEYRRPIRSFAMVASVQVAYHRAAWTLFGDPDAAFWLPSWTIGAALGLEFKIL